MFFLDKLNTPGEHPLILNGAVGQLEAVLTVPLTVSTPHVAFLGHPHSLQGGSMNNKVVTTLARTFKELGIPALRFNFRGVGCSEGVYDEGFGESLDMVELVRMWQQEQPDVQCLFAGFSFGSYVAYRAAMLSQAQLLITVAPPVHHYNYHEFNSDTLPWLIIQGDEDEVVPFKLVKEFAEYHNPPLPFISFAQTSHFFHGKLLELKSQVMDYVNLQVTL